MSSKNKLQEFFQKKELRLPEYYTTRIGGADNDPKWVCFIKLFNGETIHSCPCPSKRDAEKEAATRALEKIQTSDIGCKNIKYEFDVPPKVIVLVDGENQPVAPIRLVTEVKSAIEVVAYVTTGHPVKCKLEQYPDIQVNEVDSSRKDAVDIAITLATRDYLDKNYNHMIIVTADHFGCTLVEILNKHPYTQYQTRSYVAKNYEAVLTILKNINM